MGIDLGKETKGLTEFFGIVLVGGGLVVIAAAAVGLAIRVIRFVAGF